MIFNTKLLISGISEVACPGMEYRTLVLVILSGLLFGAVLQAHVQSARIDTYQEVFQKNIFSINSQGGGSTCNI